MSKKWYKNSLVIAASLVVIFPIGLIWMWAFATWRKVVKIGLTSIFIILFVVVLTNSSSKTSTPTAKPSSPRPTVANQVAITQATATPQPIEKLKIDITSQIVKKINGKYRYFFDIRNNDSKDFLGSVTISLYNNKQESPLGKDTFTTNQTIGPKLGNSVSIDINSGPISQHGENGITKYRFVVQSDGKEVNSGEGEISNKFENSDF